MRRDRVLCGVLLVGVVVGVAMAKEPPGDRREAVRQRIEANRPSQVTVTSVGFDRTRVVIVGYSRNANAVANFVENVKNDPMFIEPTVMYLRVRPDSSPPVYDFEFGATVRSDN